MSERLSHKKIMATGMAAAAIAGFAVESATAQSMGGRQAAGIENIQGKEAIPDVALKEKVLKMLSTGRLPNRVLDIVMTFSQESQPVFFYAPSGNAPNTRLISGSGGPRYFMGRSPREVRYSGHNWLIFNDTVGRQADPSANGEQVVGVANDTKYTYFMRTDRLPKDTRVYKSRDGDVSGHLLPAHIDKWENIVAKGIKPGEAETLVTFDSQEPVGSLVKGMGLIETHSKIDELR